MSLYHGTKTQYLAPARLIPRLGTPILPASGEARRVTDPCTGTASPSGTRARILAWLAEGAREVRWALCSLPREQWAEAPPRGLSDWPALRHARHVALRDAWLTLPAVRQALGEGARDALPSAIDLERADAAWNAAEAIESAEAIVRGLSDSRFELLQRLETAPEDAWARPLTVAAASEGPDAPVQLDWWLLHARQHELEHLAAIWRVALYWDRFAPTAALVGARDGRGPGLPLHPADRL